MLKDAAHLYGRSTFRVAAVAIGAVLLTCATVALFVPPAIGWDAAAGFRVWNSRAMGAPVNHVREICETDISRDCDRFLASFSPGQYVLPGFLMQAGMSLSRSVWVLTAVLTPLAIVGYYYLYRNAFNFTPTISILSCLIIALSRQTLHFFVMYDGGAFLQFAAFPAFLLSAIICIRRSGAYLGLLFLLFLAGAFLKLSFSLIALSLVVGVIVSVIPEHLSRPGSKPSWSRMVRPLGALVMFLLFYLTLRVLYISRGWTAANFQSGRTFGQLFFALSYSISAVVSGIVSLFSALAHIGSPLHFVMFPEPIAPRWVPALIVFTTVSLALIFWTYRRSVNISYRAFLLGFVSVHICCIAFLAAKGMVSLEERHFWPANAVLLPGLLAAVNQTKSGRGKAMAIVIAAAFIAYGVSSYIAYVKRSMNSGRSSSFGITVPGRNQRLVDTIESLDALPNSGRTVFYTSDPVLAMLVRRHPTAIAGDKFFGTTDRVIIIVDRKPQRHEPDSTVTGKFKSYNRWKWTTIDSTDIYYAGEDPLPLLNMQPLF